MKIIRLLYEVMAALMLALTAVVALLSFAKTEGVLLSGIRQSAGLFIPLAVAGILYAAFWLLQAKAEGKRAFLMIYLKAHLMAVASIATIYIALIASGAGAAAPAAIIACTIFMVIVAAVMWRITQKFKIWE